MVKLASNRSQIDGESGQRKLLIADDVRLALHVVVPERVLSSPHLPVRVPQFFPHWGLIPKFDIHNVCSITPLV